MTGLQAYRFYMAVKTHFTSKTFDVFTDKNKFSNITQDVFESKPYNHFFKSLAKKFKEPKELIQFLVASCAYGQINDIFDPIVSTNHFVEWKKNKQKTTRLILDDLYDYPISDRIIGDPPRILKDVITGIIHIETAVAINRFDPYIVDIFLNKKKYLILSEIAFKIKKLDRFVKFDEEVVEQYLQNV